MLYLWINRPLMKIPFFIYSFLFLFPSVSVAQTINDNATPAVDSLYREDQFYLGFTYNILTGMADELSSSGFSGGFHAGFIRDFPINKVRNVALGVGVGWSVNTYGQTLFIGEEEHSDETIFLALDGLDVDYDKNRFSTQSVEVPLQFRWRTSTYDSHKFWRIYTGVQLGYVYRFKSTFEQPGNSVRQTAVPEFDRFRMGATFAFGYNTFNFHFYYGLNPFFNEDARIGNQEVGMNTLRVGLMFFIL